MGTQGKIEAERMLRAFDNTEICTFTYYPDTHCIIVPERTCARYGCQAFYDDMPDSFARDMVNVNDFSAFKSIYNRIDNGEETATTEFHSTDYRFCWRVTLITLVQHEDGKPAEVLGIIEDVSDVFKSEYLINHIREILSQDRESDGEMTESVNHIATSIGGLYYAIYHIWVENRTYMCFQEKLPGILSLIGARGDYESAWNKYIENYIEPEDREGVRKFADIETLPDRLKNVNRIIHVYRRKGIGWTRGSFIAAKRDSKGYVTNIVYTVSDVNDEINRKREQKRVMYEAQHDPLTDTFNRKGFEEIISSDKVQSCSVGFAIIDVDNLKTLNDVYGHDVGDKALIKVAELLKSVFRSEDYIFRLGGDEFGVLMCGCSAGIWATVCQKMERVHRKLAQDFEGEINVTLSLGICFSEDGYDPKMYKLADEALYETKSAGRAGCTLIGMDKSILGRWHDEKLALHLQNALERSSMGVFRIEIPKDKNEKIRMICSRTTRQMMGLSNDEGPEECYRIWRAGLDKEYIDTLKKTGEIMLNVGQAECTYQWNHPQWGKIYIRSGGIGEKKNNMNILFGYHHCLKDTTIVEHKDDSSLLVAALNNIYFCSYYVDLRNDTYCTFKIAPGEELLKMQNQKATQTLTDFISVLVHQDDREKMTEFMNLQTLPERIAGEQYIDCEYMSLSDKGWCRARFLPVKHDINGRVTHVLFVIASLDSKKVETIEKERYMNRMLMLQKKASELISVSEIAAICIIDKYSGEAFVNQEIYGMEGRTGSNMEELIEDELKYVVPEEVEGFRESMKLENLREALSKNFHHLISVNLIDKEGNLKQLAHHFSEMGDGIHLISVIEDTTNLSVVDSLTQCLNKSGFIMQSGFTLRHGKKEKYAILCMDIQNFKAVNTRYGYSFGDQVLKQAAERINASNLQPLVTCRDSADKFFCLVRLEKLINDEIIRLCHFRASVNGASIPVSFDCGVYVIENNSEDIQVICDKARIACRACASRVEGDFCMYYEKLNEEYLENAYVLQNFDAAIQKKQFTVVYQPIYNAQTGKIESAEALVRWNHPEYGMISPAVFLPAIEQGGRIGQLDEYVCRFAYLMQEKRRLSGKRIVPVSVNLSRYDFFRPEISERIKMIFTDNPHISEMIRVEITESGLSDIITEAAGLLKIIREYDGKVLVDDFGSGYSSLGMLAQCDCDIVKLDMSFVRSIGKNRKAEIIIRGTIDTIHNMGLKIVAEGVETEEQYKFLKDNDCDYIQGYYFSKPLAMEEFEKKIDSED